MDPWGVIDVSYLPTGKSNLVLPESTLHTVWWVGIWKFNIYYSLSVGNKILTDEYFVATLHISMCKIKGYFRYDIRIGKIAFWHC